jgi:hypothetical protein
LERAMVAAHRGLPYPRPLFFSSNFAEARRSLAAALLSAAATTQSAIQHQLPRRAVLLPPVPLDAIAFAISRTSVTKSTRPIFNSESDPPPPTVHWRGPFGLSILLPQAHLHPNINQSSRWSSCPAQDFRPPPRVKCASFSRWFVRHSARCLPLLYLCSISLIVFTLIRFQISEPGNLCAPCPLFRLIQ